MNNEPQNSGLSLPLKAMLSPAAVIDHPASCCQNSQGDTSEPHSCSSSDYFSQQPIVYDSHIHSNTHQSNNHDSGNNYHYNALARVSEMLHKTSSDHNHFKTLSSSHSSVSSALSSTDSLASLVERQERNKINNPSHQIFESSRDKQGRKSSSISIFNLLGPALHKKNPSAPVVKSPLHNQVKTNIVSASRKLTPNHSNPTHIHSSPNVKESKKVYLEYDPVSKKKVLNTYEIVKELGRGEHGKVKLAREINSGELVAIKILDRKGKPKLGKALKPGSSEEEKIRREIAIMKKINHPNVVQLKEVLDDTTSRKIYLVLEFLEKGEVKWQKSPGVPCLTLPEAMKIFRDVVLGLEYLHYQGIIHRDIKPANLLISKDGSVKISDFGVSFASSLKNGEKQDDYDLAKTAGTPAFFAPEICQPLTNFSLDDDSNIKSSHPKITYKIDIWALGVTLYCLLFGSMPFWATNEFELFKVICDKPLEFPATFPQNFEWTEEDKFEVKNLLFKMLDKDSRKRSTIEGIKRHPIVLRNLSVEESRIFSMQQKACDSKIEVSSDEVLVAVTGIASKLRKGFAKAFKFATGIGSDPHSVKSRKTFAAQTITTSDASKTQSSHSRTASSDSRHLVIENDDLNRSSSPTLTNGSFDSSAKISQTQTSNTETRSRVKSVELSTETRATVEGDLFLKKGSALNSLSNIMNDDKKRSSLCLGTPSNSTSENYSTSNDSSFSNVGSQLVSLPVNASFASLDSVYLDNYATAYHTSVRDARAPRNQSRDKLNESTVLGNNVSPLNGVNNETTKAEPSSEFLHKMKHFSLNKTAEQKPVELVAPHEPVATFQLSDDDEDLNDDEDSEGDDDDDDEYNDDGYICGRQQSCSQVSEISVPSMFVNDLKQSMTKTSGYDESTEVKEKNKTHNASQPISKSKRPPLNGPKYSFFEGSDSDEDTEEEEDSFKMKGYQEGKDAVECFDFYSSEDAALSEPRTSEESSSEESETDKLTFSFGRRGRNNTIAFPPPSRTSSEPVRPDDHGSVKDQPPFDASQLIKSSTVNPERMSSPLSKNAPHTPFSTVNAHLIPKSTIHSNEFVNHYQKGKAPDLYRIDSAELDGSGEHLPEEMNKSKRGRSQSITVGILGHPRPRSQPI